VADLTSREAFLEVVRQEEEARTGTRSVAPDFETPTVADSGDYQATTDEAVSEPEYEEEEGHLELVPAVEDELPASQTSDQGASQDVGIEPLQEELSRTEEELVNARQENAYLTERIEELETDASAREEQSLAIQDSELANVESKLAQERAADQPEPPLAITPGGEKQAWYAGKTPLIGGVALALIALIVWGLRRRSSGLADTQRASEVQAISDDAEDVLRTLDNEESEGETVVQAIPGLESEQEPESEPEQESEQESEPEPEPEPEAEPESEPEPEPEPDPESSSETREFPHIPYSDEEGPTVVIQTPEAATEPEAEPVAEMDGGGEEQEEDDPEIKLDLARAYLSLGDKEASKSMLDEVLKNGNEAQKAEARQMLDEL
jgi:FimV-like protein